MRGRRSGEARSAGAQLRELAARKNEISLAEIRWLYEVAAASVAFRDATTEATRGLDLVPLALTPYLKAKAKLEGALNELRIARERTALSGCGGRHG